MPSNNPPRQQNGKPVLPPPTFKDRSNTYIVLGYAKMMKKPFSVKDIRNFTARFSRDSDVLRSIAVLEKNNSVVKVSDGMWQVTQEGIQQIYDFAKRRPPSMDRD